MSRRDDLASEHHGIFPRRRLVDAFSYAWRNARDDVPVESGQRPRSRVADRRRFHGGPPGESPRRARPAHESDLADDLVRAEAHRPWRIPRCLFRDEQLGREPRRNQLRPYRRGFDLARGDAADSGLYAQRGATENFPAQRVGGVWHGGLGRRGLSRLPEFWCALRVICSLTNCDLPQ